jgi:hypothetical protein
MTRPMSEVRCEFAHFEYQFTQSGVHSRIESDFTAYQETPWSSSISLKGNQVLHAMHKHTKLLLSFWFSIFAFLLLVSTNS